MDKIQQSVPSVTPDRSDLSDFSGPPIEVLTNVTDHMRIGQDKVVSDHMDYALRAYNLFQEAFGFEYLEYGPASAPTSEYALVALMAGSDTFKEMFKFFDGVAYDSVNFRITCSAPKGLAGGFFVGAYPFNPWGDTDLPTYYASHDLNHMTRQHLTLSPHSHLMCYGKAEDVSFTVPWQHNCDYLTRNYVQTADSADNFSLWPGTPILWFQDSGSRFVSSQTLPARIKVFVKFENLRFLAPSVLHQSQFDDSSAEVIEYHSSYSYSGDGDWSPPSDWENEISQEEEEFGYNVFGPDEYLAVDDAFEALSLLSLLEGVGHQSGFETPLIAAAVTGGEVLDALTRVMSSSFKDESDKSSYENPTAVQLAYIGDSTSTGPPPTQPIFKAFSQPGARHPIMEMIGQSQWLHTVNSGDTGVVYYANPTAPLGVPDISGTSQSCTYLRYFSQCASYWRGTIFFDFVIMGHPMAEVEYYFKILYPPWSENTTETYSQNSILQGLCSGVYVVSVPMPFMTPQDYISVVDSTTLTDPAIRNASSSLLSTSFTVVSTALDVAPVIPIAVFIRAGQDFQFLQPNPVGYSSILEHQCNIPKVDQTFETRALDTPPIDTMMPLADVESFMTIWSRALPYGSYDTSDEPIVALDWATSPFWFPMNDSAAARTLGTQNSWYVTNDYISFLSSSFLFFKGSLAFKILCLPATGFKYVSLSVGEQGRQLAHNPFTASPSQLPSKANFGYGTVATDLSQQPVLEMTIPLRSVFEWAPSNPLTFDQVLAGWYRSSSFLGQLYHNVVLHVPSGDLQDALYRKIGPDFSLAVRGLLPPPTLWVAKGNNWS